MSVRPYHSPSAVRRPWRATSRATSDSLITKVARSGASVIENRNEIRSAKTIVTESDAKNAPVTPPRNASGIWITMVLAVDPMIAGMSSFNERPARPRSVSAGPGPSFRATKCANMFSSMTIESSMIRPTAAAIPPSVMMLIVLPTTERQTIVEAIVTGTTSAITMATRQLRRNTRRTTIASAIPTMMLSRVVCIELCMKLPWS